MENSLTQFDNIKFLDEQGNERWSTRKLQTALGYRNWQNFELAIDKAKTVCINVGQNVNANFIEVSKVTDAGKHGNYPVKDYHVTRLAAFLIAMNGDEHKREISDAQMYFATMTIFAENFLNKSPKEQLKDELGMLQFVHKVVHGVYAALSRRWIVANKERARYAKVAFDYLRLEVIRADRAFTSVAKWHCGEDVFDNLNVKGDIAKMKAEIRNGGEVEVQFQLPFDKAEGNA